jgi:hypothetical protein
MENSFINQMAEQEVSQQETGLSLELNQLLNHNKKSMAKLVTIATDAVINGEIDPIKSLVYAKKGCELFSQLEKAIRPIAEEKVKLGKGEIYKTYDVAISQAEQGVKYDFTHCEDPIWNSLKAATEQAAEALKERETFLKAVTKPMDILIEGCEVVKINPPVRSGKVGLMLKMS